MLRYGNENLNLINMADTGSHKIERMEEKREPHIPIAEIWFIDE